jgi:hypothetical protein
MQTLEFTRALAEIVKELRVVQLVPLMQGWLTSPNLNPQTPLNAQEKERFSQMIFASHAGYDWLLRTEATRKILQSLKAQDLYEPTRMARIVSSVTSHPT